MPKPKFVSNVGTYGCVNGVANISFVTHIHTPKVELGGRVDVVTTTEVTADLRMDLYCLQELRDTCDKILAQNTKPAVTN